MMTMIVATSRNNVIGRGNKMPWHIPEDLAYFKQRTLGKTVVMGRKTFESIGRPLPGRENIVLTFDRGFAHPGVRVYHDVKQLMADYVDKPLMIIGGAQIYALFYPYAQALDITLIEQEVVGDTYFVAYEEDFEMVESSPVYTTNGFTYRFTQWKRIMTS